MSGFSPERRKHVLSSLVGRDKELALLLDYLQERRPLINIVGPAGVGKSRLAAEVIDRCRGPGRVVVTLELAGLDAPERIVELLAETLGVIAGPQQSTLEALTHRRPRDSEGVICLDTMEHLLPAAAPLVDELSYLVPFPLLVTSREPLSIAQETLVEIDLLDVQGHESPIESPAGRMFWNVVQRVRRGPPLDPSDPDLARLVRRLGGLPLALEIGACQLRYRGASEVLRTLESEAQVDLCSPVHGEERHRSLRAALQSSWTSLGPEEQMLLIASHLFPGGCDEVSLAEVFGDDISKPLNTLFDKSLLTYRPRTRFAPYDFVREFLWARTIPEDLEHRFVSYYSTQSRYWLCRWRDERDVDATLRAERRNLEAALELGFRRTEPQASLQHPKELAFDPVSLLLALEHSYRDSGNYSTREALLDRALNLLVGKRRLWLLLARAELRIERSQYGDAVADLDEAEKLTQRLRDDQPVNCRAHIEWLRGRTHTLLGDARGALVHLERARSMDIPPSHSFLSGLIELELGKSYEHLGERLRSEQHFLRARQLAREAGDYRSEILILLFLCDVSHQLRRPGWERYAEALQAEDSVRRSPLLRLRFQCSLASASLDEGRHSEAFERIEAAKAALEANPKDPMAAVVAYIEGAWLIDTESYLPARDQLISAIATAEALRAPRWRAVSSALLAVIHIQLDALRAAEQCHAEAHRINQGVGDVNLAGALVVIRAQIAWRCSQLTATLSNAIASASESELYRGSELLRLIVRWAERDLQRVSSQAPRSWVFDLEERSITFPDGAQLSLKRRRTLARLAFRLAEARALKPGVPLSHDELIAAGWPEERLARETALNRLNFGIVQLRRLGLRKLLKTELGSYLFDPEQPVKLLKTIEV